jgi:pseudaminic acid cytidylyltransferase
LVSIAIIPARGGSKRVPRKNIRMFHGRPMIAWSICNAIESGAFDEVVVTTDDEEIASIAEKLGAKAPFRRPKDLSNDFSPVMPVILHTINWWENNISEVDHACCIYATAPFLTPRLLAEGLNLLKDTNVDFVLSVKRFPYPVQRSLRVDANNFLRFAQPENAFIRSQDLEERYHDAGQYFAGTVDAFKKYKTSHEGRCLPIIIPNEEAIDIDTEDDWRFAEKLFYISRLQPL